MNIFVKEYSWMWHQLDLELAECRVFAYIHGLTNKRSETGGKGYAGSIRELAKRLKLNAGGVSKILRRLEDKHLIACNDGLWQSVYSVNSGVDSVNNSVDSVNKSVDSVNSPYNPLYNNIQMKRNEKIARDTIATPSPEDLPSFERLLKIYFRNKSRFQFDPQMEEECRQLWDAYEFWKRKMLLEQLFENREAVRKPRLDWTLADFDPQPENMKGQPLEKDVKYRTAKWKGSWGMYSQKDIDDFCLEVAPQPKKKITPN